MVHSLMMQETGDSEVEDGTALPEVFPYYQPIIEVASGEITSYEALARRHDDHGRVCSAGGLFHDPDLTLMQKRELDHQLRYQALRQLTSLPGNASIAVNISPQWINALDRDAVVPTLKMVRELGVDPRRVIIELTETDGDIERIAAVVRQYRQAGLTVAIDDFGAGFSQLDRVVALEPDIIKLDMQLFKQAVQGGIAEEMVKSLVAFSIKSGGRIVCEGVETEQEFHFGLKCGAHYMQGYLFSAANPGFQPPATYKAQISRLRHDFFQTMETREAEKIDRIQQIKTKVFELRQLLLSEPLLNPAHLFEEFCGIPELIRFYICNRMGDQLTANFNYHHAHQRWSSDSGPLGFNWSWRPYFYQLTVCSEQDNQRLVASGRYQDQASGKPCKTLAMALQDDRVLLVDIVAEWD